MSANLPPLNFEPFPQMVTERLILRKPENDDAETIYKLRSDENVMKFIGRPRLQNTKEGLEWLEKILSSLEKREAITWAISLKENPLLIGTIGFWRLQKEHFRGEIGYLLSPDFHGKGIMQEAMKPVLEYGFNEMFLHTIEAQVHPSNTPSCRLLERNGFIREGYFTENFYFNGSFTDTAVYSLLNKKTTV